MDKFTFSKEKIALIANNYIHNVDKFPRMYAGISSELCNYCDGIIYIDISNSQERILSTYNTAVSYARSYRDSNPELKEAIGFVVVFYDRDNIPGFAFKPGIRKDELRKLIKDINKPENPKVKNVFAGIFNEEMETIEKDLVKDN